MIKNIFQNKTVTRVINIILLLFALYSMFIWVGAYPYKEAGIGNYGIVYEVDKSLFSAMQMLSSISFVINLIVAYISKFTSKSFMIIHLVLAELCLAHTLTLFFA